jgi:hypothetical protein
MTNTRLLRLVAVVPLGVLSVLGLLGLLFVLFLLCLGFPLPFDIVGNLLFGWVPFLGRIAELSINWNGVATVTVCVILLFTGFHCFLSWFTRHWHIPVEGQEQPVWRLRWTAAIVCGVLLLFTAGIAATGLTHQTIWLVTAPRLVHSGKALIRARLSNHVKQIAIAAHSYHDVYEHLPSGGTFDSNGRGQHGWMTALLPYVEQKPLFDEIHHDLPWDHPDNAPAIRTIVRVYYPQFENQRFDTSQPAPSQWAANTRLLGGDQPLRLQDITDGLSNTLLVGEAMDQFKPWGHPCNWRDPALGLNTSPEGFGNRDRDLIIFASADGSVRMLRANMSRQVLMALSTPNGGEPIPEDY